MSTDDVFENRPGSENQILDAAIEEAFALDEVTQAMKRAEVTTDDLRTRLSRMRHELFAPARSELEEYSSLYARRHYIAIAIRDCVDPVWYQLTHAPQRKFDLLSRILYPFWSALVNGLPSALDPGYSYLDEWYEDLLQSRNKDDEDEDSEGDARGRSPRRTPRRRRRRAHRVRLLLRWPTTFFYWLVLLAIFIAPTILFFAGKVPLWSITPGVVLLVPSAVLLIAGLAIRVARYRPGPVTDILERSTAIQHNLQNIVRDDPDYREADRALAELARTIQRKLLEQSVLPTIRTQLNKTMRANNPGAPDPREFMVSSAPGLGEVEDDRFQINTTTKARLTRLLRQLPGGSVGLSGPRGVGKSTILRSITDTGTAEIWSGRNLEFYISAPVHYVAFDFISHLAMEICDRILSPLSGAIADDPQPSDSLADQAKAARTRLLAPGVVTALCRLGSFLLVLLGYSSVASAVANTPWRSHGPEIAAWSTGGIALVAVVISLLAKRRQSVLAAAAANLWLPVSATVVGATGAVYFLFGDILWAERTWIFTGGALLFITTLFLVLFRGRVRLRRAQLEDANPAPADDRPAPDEGAVPLALQNEAEWLLDALSHTRSDMSGTGAKTNAGVSAGVQVSGELSKSYQTTTTRRDLTMPDLVARLRKLIKLATSYGRVLVAIDELDKIQSVDETRRFINDIKAIFGLGRSYFIVAVSQDAMVSFERRGLALRTEIDSAFDEIVYASYLGLEEIRKLLEARVFGLTEPYVQLCYCLSGGLPRDAIRAMRSIVNAGLSAPSRILVDEVTNMVLKDEMTRYATATLSRTDLGPDDWPAEVLTTLADLRSAGVHPCRYESLAQSLPDCGGSAAMSGLVMELKVVLQFHAEVFRLFSARETARNSIDTVERLAQAHRDLGQNLAFARQMIEQVHTDASHLS
ncbi:hypothetical protein [Amycolatopsis sp. NPDC003731]